MLLENKEVLKVQNMLRHGSVSCMCFCFGSVFCAVLPIIRKSTALFKGSQALSICHSDKNSIKMKTVWSTGAMVVTGEN